MIQITDVAGTQKYLNSELIELIEAIPDTRISLVNGRCLIVRDSIPDIISRIIAYKQLCSVSVPPLPAVKPNPGIEEYPPAGTSIKNS